jgi:hypothetical protein
MDFPAESVLFITRVTSEGRIGNGVTFGGLNWAHLAFVGRKGGKGVTHSNIQTVID